MASNYGDRGNERNRSGMDSSWGTELDLNALPNFVGVVIIDDWFSTFVEKNQKNRQPRDDGQPTVWDLSLIHI